MPEKIRIVVEEGPLRGKSFVFLKHESFVFGRGRDCRVRLPEDKSISRRHFQMEIEPSGIKIRDLGSMNGTWINGVRHGEPGPETKDPGYERVSPAVRLAHGDTVKAGATVFRVSIENGGAPSVKNAAGPGPGAPAAIKISGYGSARLIAEGGSGAVYSAIRESDGLAVAIKVLTAGADAAERTKKLHRREIECLKKLSHPNLVSLLDSGFIGDTIYCVTDYCEGGSMSDFLKTRGGKLSLSRAVPLFLQSLKALAYIHVMGFVHRDLKPSNLLLGRPGTETTVKISDLGLAKNYELAGLSGITVGRSVQGTFPYMPPEQIVDFRCFRPSGDVWSMGAAFYNILTGRFPHDFPPGADPFNIVLNGPVVPLAERLPGIPARLAAVLDKALAPDAARRHANAGEMLKEFRSALGV